MAVECINAGWERCHRVSRCAPSILFRAEITSAPPPDGIPTHDHIEASLRTRQRAHAADHRGAID